MSLGIVFLSEVFGTAMLTLLGCGVVANVALKGTKCSVRRKFPKLMPFGINGIPEEAPGDVAGRRLL